MLGNLDADVFLGTILRQLCLIETKVISLTLSKFFANVQAAKPESSALDKN